MSPYAVRKALENTTTSIGDVPADKLTTGHGLLQVDRLASLFLGLSHGAWNATFLF